MDFKVALRVRSISDDAEPKCINVDCENKDVFLRKHIDSKQDIFSFDYVFDESTTQEALYCTIAEPLLDTFFSNRNVSILTYGQSGSGKTFTLGNEYSGMTDCSIGIVPRIIKDLFVRINKQDEQYSLQISFLELYNDKLRDLLSKDKIKSKPVVSILKGKVSVSDLIKLDISDSEYALKLFEETSKNRLTASTMKNAKSSRSHAIFSIYLNDIHNKILSKFSFIDLAGSESPTLSDDAKTVEEGISINQGLSCLELIINKLANNKMVVWRGPNLIKILGDSLGGNASTLFIACVNPLRSNACESLKTLEYAKKVKKIKRKLKPTTSLNDPRHITNSISESLFSELITLRKEKKERENKKFCDIACQTDEKPSHDTYNINQSNVTVQNFMEEQNELSILNRNNLLIQKNIEKHASKKRHFFLHKTGFKEFFEKKYVFRKLFQEKMSETLKESDLKIIQCKFSAKHATLRAKCKVKCMCKNSCKCISKCTCIYKTYYDLNTDSMEFFIIEKQH